MGIEETKKRALRILGKRNFSGQEMVKRLVSKGESEEDAAETVKWLVGLGYINDSEYATAIVNHYAAKGYGDARIRDELFKRGVPRDLWDEKLAGLDETMRAETVREFINKRFGKGMDTDDINRAAQALVRRGFSYDEAREQVNRYLEEQ